MRDTPEPSMIRAATVQKTPQCSTEHWISMVMGKMPRKQREKRCLWVTAAGLRPDHQLWLADIQDHCTIGWLPNREAAVEVLNCALRDMLCLLSNAMAVYNTASDERGGGPLPHRRWCQRFKYICLRGQLMAALFLRTPKGLCLGAHGLLKTADHFLWGL